MSARVIRLSLPAIVSNITVPLLGLCDTAISGHLGSELYLAAISVGAIMMNVLTWACGFLRMGTTGITAIAFGRGDEEGIRRVFTRAFILAILLGIGVIAFSEPLCRLFLAFISPEAEVARCASAYFRAIVWSLPAVYGTMAVNGWFVGCQNTFWPMVVAITTNIINIGLSFILAFPFGMGFEGVYIGTLTANWTGLIIALAIAMRARREKGLWLDPVKALSGGGMGRFFSVNSDLFLRSACITAVSMSVTAIGARLGELTLATNAILMQFFTFFSFFMDGFAFAGEALCGRYAGAHDFRLLKSAVRNLLGWSAAMALIFFLIYLFASKGITELLTDSGPVRDNVERYRAWVLLLPPVTVMAFIFDGIFIGLTATRRMLVATFVSALLFVAIVLSAGGCGTFELPDNNRLWAGFMAYLALRGIILAASTPSLLRKAMDYNIEN